MWTSENHPGGYGRRYKYKDTNLYRLSCWWYQPSQHVPKGALLSGTHSSCWINERTAKESSSIYWQLQFVEDWWQIRLSFTANGRYIEQFVKMTPDAVARSRGQRWWWQCPNCGRRCGMLFAIPSTAQFACRTCEGVTYTTRLKKTPRQAMAKLGLYWPRYKRWEYEC